MLENNKQKILGTKAKQNVEVSFFKSLKPDIQIRVMHATDWLIHGSKSTGGTKNVYSLLGKSYQLILQVRVL